MKEERIEQLRKEIEYDYKRMAVCAYGKRELLEVQAKEEELEKLLRDDD